MSYKDKLREKLKSRINKIKAAQESLLDFTTYTFPKYEVSDFHNWITKDLDEFVFGDCNKMMLFAPPQHGKSELSSRRLPALLLGLNPSLKIAMVCYNATVARGFNKNVQDIILSDEYRSLFPRTVIKGVTEQEGIDELKKAGRQLEKNSYMFETTAGGYFISVGVGGGLTSKTVDVLIMDDLYKGAMDAYSPVFRKRVVEFYNTVAETRLHNKSKQLILYTRWHEEDLAGVLLEKESELWKVLKYEILKRNEYSPRDTRKLGEALWENRHSKEKSLRWMKNDPVSFEALGMQDPKPNKGLLYPNQFKTYTKLPQGLIENYTDTADKGNDYLASVSYIKSGDFYYIVDMIYTQKAMEETLEMVSEMFNRLPHHCAVIESNNGGRGFAREIRQKLTKRFLIEDFTQTQNKEARILSNSVAVNDKVIFPDGWESKYPDVYKSLTRFMRDIRANEHDDIEDVLTAIIERGNRIKAKAIQNPFAL
jgi:predicted phage terminase large subunit-like protein